MEAAMVQCGGGAAQCLSKNCSRVRPMIDYTEYRYLPTTLHLHSHTAAYCRHKVVIKHNGILWIYRVVYAEYTTIYSGNEVKQWPTSVIRLSQDIPSI